MLKSLLAIQRLVLNAMLSSISTVSLLKSSQRPSLGRNKILMMYNKYGNVNSAITQIRFVSRTKKSPKTRLWIILLKQLLKCKTKRWLDKRTHQSSSLWISLDRCASQLPFKASINSKETRPKNWKTSWSSAMALISFFKVIKTWHMSAGCNAFKQQLISKSLILEMELLIERLAWSLLMIRSLSWVTEPKTLKWFAEINYMTMITWSKMDKSKVI